MKAMFKDEWDYLGWKDCDDTNYHSQHSWSQTLLTKINHLSVKIFKESYRGGANTIIVHPKSFMLLKDLEYFNVNETGPSIAGRYNIKVDESIDKDKIYVKHIDEMFEKIKVNMNNPNLVRAFKIKTSEGEFMSELEFKFIERNGNEELTEDGFKFITEEMLTGEITIKNHRVIDPVTGEILIDYFNEISEDIWLPSPRYEGEDFEPIPYNKEILDAVLPNSLHSSFVEHGILKNDTPKMKFKIPVGHLPESEQKSFFTKLKELIKIK